MPDSSSEHPHIVIIAKCLRRRISSHRRPGRDLRSFINNEVAESGQSNEFLHSRAVGMVGSGLTQDNVAAKLGVRPGNTSELNPRENLREIIQQELDCEEPSTSFQQLSG